MSRLTKPLLRAMEEALAFRLAGEIGDETDVPTEHYERAYGWVCDQLDKRETK